jgi:starch synthase (maltosyl-transferring)
MPRTPRGTEPHAVPGRIPILDISPRVEGGARSSKSVVGEPFEVSATVFREGDGAVGANVVLRDPEGRSGPWTPMAGRLQVTGSSGWSGCDRLGCIAGQARAL